MLAQSAAHQFVVYVILVGMEDVDVMADADERYACYIKTGYQHKRIGQQERIGMETDGVRTDHDELHGEESQSVAQRQRPRIAHENLAVFLALAEYVVVKESDQNAH